MDDTWHVYMLRCSDDTFYIGVTTDLERRLREHNESDRLGARYTRSRRPVELVWSETQSGRALALKREYALKRLSRASKLKLLNSSMSGSCPTVAGRAQTNVNTLKKFQHDDGAKR